MSRVEDFEEYYSEVQYELPPVLQEDYEALSVLGEKENKSIILIRDKSSGKKYVLKYVNGIRPELQWEYEALKEFEEQDIIYSESEHEEYLIRPYIEGVSLEQRIEEEGVLERGRALDLLKKLCDKLEQLRADGHNIIHRDIKPANIILTPENDVRLIDFECARSFDESKTTDTVFFGTIDTAAPEQYGYAQSDVRTDIYGIGKTLCYALTESFNTDGMQKMGVPIRLRRIVKKCTQFNPKHRYQSIKELKNAATARGSKIALFLLAALAVIGTPVALGIHREYENQVVDIDSKAMELAVRAELQKPEGAILRSDLKKIHRLAIVGMETFSSGQVYTCRVDSFVDEVEMNLTPEGDISDLSLLKSMPNLEELYLCKQQIKDISPLKGLKLHTLALTTNQIEDISALENMTSLRTLYIGLNPIKSYEPLGSLSNLYELNLDRDVGIGVGVRVPSLEALKGLPIHRLSLGNVEPVSGGYSFMAELDELEYLFLWRPKEEYFEDIAKAPRLNEMFIGEYMGSGFGALGNAKNLQVLGLHDRFNTIDGIEKIKSLKTISLAWGTEVDLSPLEGADNLQSITIRDMNVTHFDTLKKLPNLIDVNITEDLVQQFNEECKDYDFIMNVWE